MLPLALSLSISFAIANSVSNIFCKSPPSIPVHIPTLIKESLNYGRDHTTEESLNHIALWNNAMGIGDEMSVAFKAKAEKIKSEK